MIKYITILLLTLGLFGCERPGCLGGSIDQKEVHLDTEEIEIVDKRLDGAVICTFVHLRDYDDKEDWAMWCGETAVECAKIRIRFTDWKMTKCMGFIYGLYFLTHGDEELSFFESAYDCELRRSHIIKTDKKREKKNRITNLSECQFTRETGKLLRTKSHP